jgi:hypothetical protein
MPRTLIRGAAAAVAAVSTTGLLLAATDNTAESPPGPDADRTATAPARTDNSGVAAGEFGRARDAALDGRVAATRAHAATKNPSPAARASRGRARAPIGGSPKAIARGLAASRGWGDGQFACLESLWQQESRWNPRGANPSSGAYGIPQARPGAKMATYGADWRTNPTTQIRWGLDYIDRRYATPCAAWSFSRAHDYY